MSSSTANKPTVIIIGAGYAGVRVAKELDKSHEYHVILVERNSYFLHNIAALRASAQPQWIDGVLLDYNKLLINGGKVIQATVTQISPTNQEIYTHEHKQALKYDYLIIATGASYRFPGQIVEPSIEHAKGTYRKLYNDVDAAQRIVIVGGGPVGIELAGEISAVYNQGDTNNKEITLVHGGPHLLSSHTGLKPAVGENLRQILQTQLHVNVLLNDAVTVPASLLSSKQLYINTPTQLATKSGKQLEADLVLYTIGGLPNTEFLLDSESLAPAVFDGSGHIKVNEFLQVESEHGDVKYSNIYAVGDVATFQPGMAYYAGRQGSWLATHLIDLKRGKQEPKPIQKAPVGMVLPLGNKLGAGQLPLFGGWHVGSTITSMLKGKGLGVEPYKKVLNLK